MKSKYKTKEELLGNLLMTEFLNNDSALEAMKLYAQQESERAVLEFKSELKDFLHEEITERRNFSASKMCEIIIEKLK